MPANLLLEIGCEELPTSFLDGALAQVEALLPEELGRAGIAHGAVRVLGTARRIAAVVSDVADAVPAREEELLGPPESAARTPDGRWSKAAEGFAKKSEVPLDVLEIADTAKGRYLRAIKRTPGASAASLLPAVLAAVCRRITFAKSMRWADLDTAFGRPVQWLVALHGAAVVPFAFAGHTADRVSRGHRFLTGSAPVILEGADGYVDAMRAARVFVDPAERRADLVAALHAAARAEGGVLKHDAFLEGEVLGLVEAPHVVVGRFEEKYLALPDALIESVMRGHQRYFAVERADVAAGAVSGRLLPVFLTVVNTANDPDAIRRGNERVMRARLADAAFFVEQDRRAPLHTRVASLDAVAFHAKLGSYGAKVRRLEKIAPWLAERMGANPSHAARAAELCKADLVSLAVGEFPELQGLMGGYYAHHDGEAQAVCEAVATHYQPRGASDDVAPTPVAAALALADRLDTLVGCLGVKLRPTGSEDPFGLRRIAIGVLRTLLHHRARISLPEAAGFVWDVFEAEGGAMIANARREGLDRHAVAAMVTDFCNERLKGLLEERFSRDAIAACMAARREVPVDVLERAEALGTFWQTPAAEDLAVAFKRVFKISRDAPEGELGADDRARLTEPAEVALIEAFERTRAEMGPLFAARRYAEALELIARSLRAPVDRLFNEVFVMAEDPALRASRLRLLGRIADAVGGFARFDALD